MYLLLIAAAFLFSFCEAAPPALDIQEDTDGILVLNTTNFNTTITRHNLVTVMFYEGQMSKEYAAVAAKLKNDCPQIKMAKVNVSQQNGLAKSFKLTKFPKLLFFKSGIPSNTFNGLEKEDKIVKWILDVARDCADSSEEIKAKWCSCINI